MLPMSASNQALRVDTPPQAGSGAMFDAIARRYDLLNRLMSLGLDQSWRRKLVRSLAPGGAAPTRVLDVATGTADVALAVARRYPGCQVEGLDPSGNMLLHGLDKVRTRGLAQRVRLVRGDAQAMPWPDASFDAACVSFGIRNVPDRALGVREMARVTRPGGVVAILELNEPREGLLAPFARFHVHHVVPRLGAWLSGAQEYRYLQASIAAFPPPREFCRVMEEAGLGEVSFRRLGFGAACLFTGRPQR
jgi:demethylmenaquinone methyltransferase / 2-methoxy-6-polyprenyl-1,4-benzoquinol methylase